MQTFLPFSSFTQSTAVLDRLRLGKQRLEAKQILNTLQRRHDDPNGSYGWKNHPAVLAWERYEDALKLYYNTCILTWIDRGFNNTMVLVPLINHIGHQVQVQSLKDVDDLQQQVIMPPWLGNDDFHRSHQSNLIRKDTDFYQHKFPNVNGDLPYIWPSSLIQL